MQNVKLGFDSATYAMEAREYLARRGIKAEVVRISGGNDGCSFALEIPVNNAAAAEALLSKSNMRYTHTK